MVRQRAERRMNSEQFSFKFTHKKRSDGRVIGILPAPTDEKRTVYAYCSPQDGGQAFEMGTAEFDKRFATLG